MDKNGNNKFADILDGEVGMSYTKTTWVDDSTPLSAANMNKIETGVDESYKLYNPINGLSAITPVSDDMFPFLDASGGVAGKVSLSDLLVALGGALIASGTYNGTGTYGSSNQNSLILPFSAKLLFITKDTDGAKIALIGKSRGAYLSLYASNATNGALTNSTIISSWV